MKLCAWRLGLVDKAEAFRRPVTESHHLRLLSQRYHRSRQIASFNVHHAVVDISVVKVPSALSLPVVVHSGRDSGRAMTLFSSSPF
jgi:hypothetical protein